MMALEETALLNFFYGITYLLSYLEMPFFYNIFKLLYLKDQSTIFKHFSYHRIKQLLIQLPKKHGSKKDKNKILSVYF